MSSLVPHLRHLYLIWIVLSNVTFLKIGDTPTLKFTTKA